MPPSKEHLLGKFDIYFFFVFAWLVRGCKGLCEVFLGFVVKF